MRDLCAHWCFAADWLHEDISAWAPAEELALRAHAQLLIKTSDARARTAQWPEMNAPWAKREAAARHQVLVYYDVHNELRMLMGGEHYKAKVG